MSIYKVGSKGSVVKAIQRAVGADPDGVYGPKTRKAVQLWQASVELDADGVAGKDTLCALGLEFIRGIDVSHHNGQVNFHKVQAAGYKFVFIKATQGTSFVSKAFVKLATEAHHHGLLVGAYHYGEPQDGGAEDEASHFLKQVQGLPFDLDFPLVLDLEEDASTIAKTVSFADDFLKAVQPFSVSTPLLYTGKWFIDGFLGKTKGKALAHWPLWVARYTNKPDPGDVGGWDDWLVWQHGTKAGIVPGVVGKCDQNVIVGHRALELLKGVKPCV